MPRAPVICSKVGCARAASKGARCSDHPYEDTRPSAAERGYDHKWMLNSRKFLKAHPSCVGYQRVCGRPATVADHVIPRITLVQRGVAHPDAWEHLASMCAPCHHDKTADESAAKNAVLKALER